MSVSAIAFFFALTENWHHWFELWSSLLGMVMDPLLGGKVVDPCTLRNRSNSPRIFFDTLSVGTDGRA